MIPEHAKLVAHQGLLCLPTLLSTLRSQQGLSPLRSRMSHWLQVSVQIILGDTCPDLSILFPLPCFALWHLSRTVDTLIVRTVLAYGRPSNTC